MTGFAVALCLYFLAFGVDGQQWTTAGNSFSSSSRPPFSCSNGTTIPWYRKCNGRNDCGDNSDEADCQCMNWEVPCANGECIYRGFKCNGRTECEDNSDEDGCPKVTCRSDQFACANGIKCIQRSWKCDQENDCHDNSDEADCPCNWGFHCANGECIHRGFKCNGHNNCGDNSDEDGCPKVFCRSDQFACANGIRCIRRSWKCDREDDCHDNSDEVGCPANATQTTQPPGPWTTSW